jgi:hypothetical protein
VPCKLSLLLEDLTGAADLDQEVNSTHLAEAAELPKEAHGVTGRLHARQSNEEGAELLYHLIHHRRENKCSGGEHSLR